MCHLLDEIEISLLLIALSCVCGYEESAACVSSSPSPHFTNTPLSNYKYYYINMLNLEGEWKDQVADCLSLLGPDAKERATTVSIDRVPTGRRRLMCTLPIKGEEGAVVDKLILFDEEEGFAFAAEEGSGEDHHFQGTLYNLLSTSDHGRELAMSMLNKQLEVLKQEQDAAAVKNSDEN